MLAFSKLLWQAFSAGIRIVQAMTRFETRSLPRSLAAARRGFTFYVADPISSIHEPA
jgi:hypothetical protein